MNYKELPVGNIKALIVKSVFCMDSLGKITSNCNICYESFDVDFFKFYYNQKDNKAKLVGRTSFPEIGIYLSNKKDSISIYNPLSESTAIDDYWNFGFFDVEIKLEKGLFLFFYTPQMYIIRYNIGELIEKTEVSKKRG